MVILAIFKTNAVTKQMYEELRKEVDWEHQHPDGALFHAGAFDDSGNFCVADIWESQEHLNNFVNNRLLPVMKKIICQCLRERFFKSMMLVLFQALVSIESGIKHNSQDIDEIGEVTKHCFYLEEPSKKAIVCGLATRIWVVVVVNTSAALCY